jgi:hypothetical protein
VIYYVYMVSVAKWLRHWTVTLVFAGSNPVVHPCTD